jgi:hypothetical protein
MEGYIERVQFQGSSWNDANHPWRFYINFGVEFSDLPARSPCHDFPATHCWTRIEYLVAHAPKQFDLPEGDVSKFTTEIADYLEYASRHIVDCLSKIRSNYESRRSPRLEAQ